VDRPIGEAHGEPRDVAVVFLEIRQAAAGEVDLLYEAVADPKAALPR